MNEDMVLDDRPKTGSTADIASNKHNLTEEGPMQDNDDQDNVLPTAQQSAMNTSQNRR